MKLTVFGPTGGTGAEVVRQALAGGHEVRAVARRPAAVAGQESDRLTVLPGDVLDPASLEGAVTGVDGVLSALGSPPRSPAAAVHARGTAAVADAMLRAGVRRIVAVSASPAAPAAEKSTMERLVIHPLLESVFGVYEDMRRMESLLAASDLDWTVFRPPRLLDRPGTGRYRAAVGARLPRGRSLPRADLATAMLAAIDDPALVRQAVTIAT